MKRITRGASTGMSARTGRPKCSSLKNKPGKMVPADKEKVEVLNNIFASVFTGNIQGQVGKNSEQPELVEDVPAYCRGLGPDEL